MAALITDKRKGKIVGDEYKMKMASVISGFWGGIKIGASSVFEIEKLLKCGECLGAEDRLLFFMAVQFHTQIGAICVPEKEPLRAVFRHGVEMCSEKLAQYAIASADEMRKQGKWTECLNYCKLVERCLPYVPPQPFYFLESGIAYKALGRAREAYDAFVKGEEAAKSELKIPNLTEAQCASFTQARDHCHRLAQEVRAQLAPR